MFGSEILDVAVGLIFVYLLLGLICSAVNEWIARMLALRASILQAGIRNLLEGEKSKEKKPNKDSDEHSKTKDEKSNKKTLAEKFYDHSMIKGICKKGIIEKIFKRKPRPSYISNRTFALTLLDLLTPSEEGGSDVIKGIKDGINKLPETSDLKKSLLLLITDAENDIKKLQKNIEEWFDTAMERVSGWYKRRTQTITFIVAVIVSIGLNVDTITIADHLYRHDSVRTLAVTAAQQAVQQPLPDDTTSLSSRLKKAKGELDKLQLPIGWQVKEDKVEKEEKVGKKDKEDKSNESWNYLYKIVGWLLTAFALSLGAPFWFDVLKKLVNLRATGTAPEKVTEEKPKKPLELRISTEGGK